MAIVSLKKSGAGNPNVRFEAEEIASTGVSWKHLRKMVLTMMSIACSVVLCGATDVDSRMEMQ